MPAGMATARVSVLTLQGMRCQYCCSLIHLGYVGSDVFSVYLGTGGSVLDPEEFVGAVCLYQLPLGTGGPPLSLPPICDVGGHSPYRQRDLGEDAW